MVSRSGHQYSRPGNYTTAGNQHIAPFPEQIILMAGKKMKVAAVHASPVVMDKDATIQKVLRLIHDAAARKIDLLVFPEVFIPGYPHFIWTCAPIKYFDTMIDYGKHSMDVFDVESVRAGRPKPSADMMPILEACKTANVTIVLGISERYPFSPDTTLFNSQVFISRKGHILGVHRKLVPTYSERSVWAYGAGATLKCWNASLPSGETFRLGGLACGENINLGAKLALIDEGQEVHAASWPGQCAIMEDSWAWEEIKLCAQAHSSEAMVFSIAASTIVNDDEVQWANAKLGKQELLKTGSGWSGIVAPGGKVIAEDCGGMEERLIIADIDLGDIPLAKLMNDPAGHYRRPETLTLRVNREAVWADDIFIANPGAQNDDSSSA